LAYLLCCFNTVIQHLTNTGFFCDINHEFCPPVGPRCNACERDKSLNLILLPCECEFRMLSQDTRLKSASVYYVKIPG